MIERQFIQQKTKEHYIKKYLEEKLSHVGVSQIKLKKIPLGEKIIIYTNRPSLIVGSKGANIKELTKILKRDFKLENPQIEINEVKELYLDATLVAERIASSLERFGSARFKGIGHKIMENIINSGALGVEVTISGKIPGARAKSWRFYQGYLKKCGDISIVGVRRANTHALLKSGVVGIKVAIMPPDVKLPDRIKVREEQEQGEDAVKAEAPLAEKKKTTRKRTPRKKGDRAKTDKEKTTPKAEAPVTPEEQEPTSVEGEPEPTVEAETTIVEESSAPDAETVAEEESNVPQLEKQGGEE